MRDDILKTVEVLREKILAKEAELAGLKSIINGLYREENEPAPYPESSTRPGASLEGLRSDQFYGQTLAGATRQYLEMRKAAGQGAASVSDIFYALKKGGFKFEAKTEENAKNGVRLALRKNSITFHRLPNSDYGLLEWYEHPKAEQGSEQNGKKTRRHRKGKRSKRIAESGTEVAQTNGTPSASRTDRIFAILKANPGKEWGHMEVHAQLPEIKPELIRPLLYALEKADKIVKSSPGKFKAAVRLIESKTGESRAA